MFRNLGTTEIIVIAVVIILLFGGKKIPAMGEAVKEFRRAIKEDEKK
jgi:sec-independent protein translocase protein TatA